MKPPETLEATVPYALEILQTGSGAAVDSPFHLGHVHPLLASSVERAVVSLLFQSQDWSPVERLYHKNGQVFEWRIKRSNGQILPVFFDISQVNDSAPVSDAVRQQFNQRSDTVPVPDTTLISRFPLIKVEARSAAEAADFISSHLERAARDGWQLGTAMALADGWRNDYELTRGNEKTKMSFDMRPCLVLNSMDLTMLTLMAGKRRGETFVQQHAHMLLQTDDTRRAPPGSAVEKAIKSERKSNAKAYVVAIGILVSMPLTAAAAYYLTHSVILAVLGFFVPIVVHWIRGLWLIMGTARLLAETKRKFPDVER